MLSATFYIDVSFLPRPVTAAESVVLIDVLRFTTTSAVALHSGVTQIFPCRTVEECHQTKSPGELLAGEKQGQKIAGFDLGNSPSTFWNASYGGRTVRFVTSNGSPACHLAAEGREAFLGSFVNQRALAERLLQSSSRRLTVLCSGAKGEPCTEDTSCAGALIARMKTISAGKTGFELTENAAAAESLWKSKEGQYRDILFGSAWGKRLLELGLQEDLEVAARLDLVSTVPVLRKDPVRVELER